MILPDFQDPPRHYRIPLAKGTLMWLTDNRRLNWRRKASLVKSWRMGAALTAGVLCDVPMIPGAHVVAELRFGDKRRRDPNNWNPTAKACIDGFVDAKLFPDDRAEVIEGPDMRLGPVVPRGMESIIFHIWPKR